MPFPGLKPKRQWSSLLPWNLFIKYKRPCFKQPASFVLLLLATTLTAVTAPPNDNFNAAIVLTGSSIVTNGSNVGATKQLKEPNHGGNTGGASVWWSWTAPFTGGTTITTAGSDFNTLLGVYTGNSVAALTTVASDGRKYIPASVTFNATSGITYMIAVDGFAGATGSILLSLNLGTPPANDNFTNSIAISSGTVVTGQNLAATMESMEPKHAGIIGGKSVWWSWTSPSNCCVAVTTAGSDFDTLLAVYTNLTGPYTNILPVANLVAVATNDDMANAMTSFADFHALAGVTYEIAVDGYDRASGNIILQLLTYPGPSNDNFANAISLAGTNVSTTASNIFFATPETGEPQHGSDTSGKSLWWQWTAPASGGVSINTLGSDFSPTIAVYTGSAVTSLTPVTNGTDHIVFKVVGGVVYNIALADDAVGQINLNLNYSPSPSNDNFANSPILGEFGGTQNGSNYGATSENGEPAQGGAVPPSDLWGESVWWNWASAYSFPITISTTSGNFISTISLFSGNTITNLTHIATSVGTTPTNILCFQPTPYVNYEIAVDGNSGVEGSFTMTIALATSTPTNDNFTNAIMLSGSNIFTTGNNLNATVETGEPSHAGEPDAGSVWWSWKSSSPGRLFVSTAGSSFPPQLAVYQGPDVAHLTSIASASSSVIACPGFSFLDFDITATSPQTYQIAVDGTPNTNYGQQTEGSINLALAFVPEPVNDNFASRIPLTGSYLTVTGSVIAASQEAGEIVDGYSSGLRTVWYSWIAPTNLGGTSGSVTLRVTGTGISATTNDPIVGIFQGNSLTTLSNVPVVTELFGNMRQVNFTAQAGSTYQIAIAGGQSTGEGVDTSFAQRTSAVPPAPLLETGAFLLHLNYTTLALSVSNIIPDATDFINLQFTNRGAKIPFGAGAQIINYGANPSGPVRVRLVTLTSGGVVMSDEGSFYPPGNTGLATGSNATISLSGACLPSSEILAVLEEQVGGDWFFRDSSIVIAGNSSVSYLCYAVLGGGVTLLEPGLSGQCFCPANLVSVQINGPTNVVEGSAAAYTGTAYFDNGSSPNFTNTIWATSDTNRFPITTNGILTAGSVTSNTPISVTSYFSYLGVTQSTNKSVTILNLPPPQLTNVLRLPNGTVQLSIEGVPGREHVIEAATNLTAPIVWTELLTNATGTNGSAQPGLLIFIDQTATNFNHRFYRAREF